MKTTIALLVCATALSAQQTPPKVRLLNLPVATSKPTLGLVGNVRQLPNGSVLVNDIVKRQLVLFDAGLTNATIVLDSSTAGNSYGPRGGSLIPYGDSTLFVDGASLSMLVLDANGAIARVMSVPRSQDANFISNTMFGTPGFDAKGRLVYRAMVRPQMAPFVMGSDNRNFVMPEPPDSAPVIRIDMATRKPDTVAYFKVPKVKMNVTRTEGGGVQMMSEMNPLPLTDDWAVLSDGAIAIVRGRDYHVDWIGEDGTIAPSAKIPYDWQRLSDEDKIAIVDSAKAAYERNRAAALANPNAAGRGGEGGAVRTMVIMGGEGRAGAEAAIGGRGGPNGGPGMNMTFISPSELPDYRPVFTQGASLRPDADGHLWIRTTATRAGVVAGPIYDVIDRKGELIDRVQVPAGRTIVGFGKGGVVYLVAREDAGSKLEKAVVGPRA